MDTRDRDHFILATFCLVDDILPNRHSPTISRVRTSPAARFGVGPRRRRHLATFEEAARLGHRYIGSRHLLLGLMENERVAGALAQQGVSGDAVRRAATRFPSSFGRSDTPQLSLTGVCAHMF